MGKRLIKMWFWNGIIANIVSNNPIEITNIPADKFLMLLYTTVQKSKWKIKWEMEWEF